MTIDEMTQIHREIKSMETRIALNIKDFMHSIYTNILILERESDNGTFELGEFNDLQFKFKYFEYEITVTNMNTYASPVFDIFQLEGEKPTLNNICQINKLHESYSGCISLYFYDPKLDNYDLIYLDRIFINKNFDIAFQGYNKYAHFDKKEIILKDLKQIIINMLSELFLNFQHLFPAGTDIMQINPEVIKSRRFNIGFKL